MQTRDEQLAEGVRRLGWMLTHYAAWHRLGDGDSWEPVAIAGNLADAVRVTAEARAPRGMWAVAPVYVDPNRWSPRGPGREHRRRRDGERMAAAIAAGRPYIAPEDRVRLRAFVATMAAS